MSRARKPKRLRGRVRYITGVRFVSDRSGWWFSECGQYAIFRMLSGTSHQQWELYRRGKNEFGRWDDCLELISLGLSLKDLMLDKDLKLA